MLDRIDALADKMRAVSDALRRRPSGGLWSTVDDLVRFGSHHLDGAPDALHEPLSLDQLAVHAAPQMGEIQAAEDPVPVRAVALAGVQRAPRLGQHTASVLGGSGWPDRAANDEGQP